MDKTERSNGSTSPDVVWPDTKQIGLIDSILRNFYIPPVIFGMDIIVNLVAWVFDSFSPVAHQHEDGSETKTCIDGKQRLTSIQRHEAPVHDLLVFSNMVALVDSWMERSVTRLNTFSSCTPDLYLYLDSS